ncbi:LptF/LptG family permease [Phenylobacterium montanum]|uniref:LptF/LptG family permease n=1 Tax=Phenylobacterium montanum TaxID=2823693 RepID=A0A975IVW9_9CAUL|nr:LptF/LptG family permease [Caulobacter sp. S6]QUD88994.1 LptF/LptG family permease [Caulobacter sp. S6]
MRLSLTRIESYVLSATLLGVGVALAVIAAVIMLADFVELSRTLGVGAELGFSQTLRLTLLHAPSVILLLLPFAFLFGVLGAFVNLNRRSELIAMRAAGVSAWRFIFPAAGAAVVIGLVAITILNPVASALAAQYERDVEALRRGAAVASGKEIWLRQGDSHTQIVIHAHRQVSQGETLVLTGVSLFVSTPSKDHKGLEFSRRIEAQQAKLTPGAWLLTGAREATPGAEALRYDSLTLPTTLEGRTALERFTSPKAVPFWGLWDAISRTELAGFPATGYRLQLDELLATPLLLAAMSVLAAAFSLRLIRLGGLAGLAGSGVALGFVLFFFNQFCRALGEAGAIPPMAAAWTPPVLALLSGFTLLCYTEDG